MHLRIVNPVGPFDLHKLIKSENWRKVHRSEQKNQYKAWNQSTLANYQQPKPITSETERANTKRMQILGKFSYEERIVKLPPAAAILGTAFTSFAAVGARPLESELEVIELPLRGNSSQQQLSLNIAGIGYRDANQSNR